MGSLLNSTIGKLVSGLLLAMGSAAVSHVVSINGKVPEARIEAVREQRSELIALVDFFTTHCLVIEESPPAVSEGVSKRLPEAAQAQVPVK